MLRSTLAAVSLLIASTTLLRADDADAQQRAKDERIVQTVQRLPGFDLNSKPEAKAAVLRHLSRIEGDRKYFELVEKFGLAGDVAPRLLQQMIDQPESTQGANAALLLLKSNATEELTAALNDRDNDETAAQLLTALGLARDPKTVPLAVPIVTDSDRSLAVRAAAVGALGKVTQGQQALLEIVVAEKLPADLQFATANVLLNSPDEAIKTQASKHLMLPATADAQPLPPVAELVKRSGDASAGRQVFENKGTCAKCHVVGGEGKEVGPNLSEIGSKLSKEALYLSILDPSAGVSFNYETSQIVTTEGQILTGIVTSDTDEAVTLKTPEAVVRVIPKEEIEEINKLKISLMPADLQRQLTAQELVDVVEYLTTLKKP